MSRKWNYKALIDRLLDELWYQNNASNRSLVTKWLSQTMFELSSERVIDHYKFPLKKLFPTSQQYVNVSPDIASAPTVAISSGGSLTDGSDYKVLVTFEIKHVDGTTTYIESEQGVISAEVTADATNKTISASDIPLYGGDTSVEPSIIYRNIYVAIDANDGNGYGEPLYHGQITDNTTTTYSVTTEPTSARTPPSSSEVDQLNSDHIIFSTGNRIVQKVNANRLKRFDPNSFSTTTPDAFDYQGLDRIFLYGQLSASATTAQRTAEYVVQRRPHHPVYDIDVQVDAPIQAEPAIIAGVLYMGWRYKDRDGWVSQKGVFEEEKKKYLKKVTRQRGRPTSLRDYNGDTDGFEVN